MDRLTSIAMRVAGTAAEEGASYTSFSGAVRHGGSSGQVRNATFRLMPEGKIEWMSGTWLSGTWDGGIWRDGTWETGIWNRGVWKCGTWKATDGKKTVWKRGTWKLGNWMDGTWENGTWEYGFWKNGEWLNGTWRNGSWNGGTWLGGIHEDGEWYGGKFDFDDRTAAQSVWMDGLWMPCDMSKWIAGEWRNGHGPDGTRHGKPPTEWAS